MSVRGLSSGLVASLLAAGVIGCGSGSASAPSRSAVGRVPFLVPFSPTAPERDDPAAVQARLMAEQRTDLALLRAAAAAKPSAAAGCVRPSNPIYGAWVPPAPRVRAVLLGHQLLVSFSFASLPSSPACRPAGVSVAVSSSGSNRPAWVEQFKLAGARGRLITNLPYDGVPPYHLTLMAETLRGTRSDYIERDLSCPPAGCLDGPKVVSAHAPVRLSKTLPLAGLSRQQLVRSFSEVLQQDSRWPRPGPVTCRSLHECLVSFSDPAYRAHFELQYAISGERVRGCWVAVPSDVTHAPSNTGALGGRIVEWLGGCARWPA